MGKVKIVSLYLISNESLSELELTLSKLECNPLYKAPQTSKEASVYCSVWPIKCRQGSKTKKSNCEFWKKLTFDWLQRILVRMYVRPETIVKLGDLGL
jgi:hypothetical protein